MPAMSGFLDHGMLIDRIGVTVKSSYSGRDRTLWSCILLHNNDSIHLVGIDLDNDEQRTFRLDRIMGMSVPPLGDVGRESLYWQLQSLCASRERWLPVLELASSRTCMLARPRHRVDMACFLTLLKAGAAIWNLPETIARTVPAPRQAWESGAHACFRLRADAVKRIRAFRAARRPASGKYRRRAALIAEMPSWRRRLLRAIITVEAGGVDEITCLLPMNALLKDAQLSHAYLRHLVELALAEGDDDSTGHPLAPQLLAEALALSSGMPRSAPPSERKAAYALIATEEPSAGPEAHFDPCDTPGGEELQASAVRVFSGSHLLWRENRRRRPEAILLLPDQRPVHFPLGQSALPRRCHLRVKVVGHRGLVGCGSGNRGVGITGQGTIT